VAIASDCAVIDLEDYFGPWWDDPDATPAHKAAAEALLARVNALLEEAANNGIEMPKNPQTASFVSGQNGGGFRPSSYPVGALHSAHKEGRAVDVYDRGNALDHWLNDRLLEEFGLYREHPTATPGWCHLTDRAPPSGKRTFSPR